MSDKEPDKSGPWRRLKAEWINAWVGIFAVVFAGFSLLLSRSDSHRADQQFELAQQEFALETKPDLVIQVVKKADPSAANLGTQVLCTANSNGSWTGRCLAPPPASSRHVATALVAVTNIGRSATSDLAVPLAFWSVRSPKQRYLHVLLDVIPVNATVYFAVANESESTLTFQGTGEAFDEPVAAKVPGAPDPPPRTLQAHCPRAFTLPPSPSR